MKDFSHQFRTPGFLKKKSYSNFPIHLNEQVFFFSLNGEMIKQPFNE